MMASLFFKLLLSLSIIIVLIYLVLRFIKNQQLLHQKRSMSQKAWIKILDYQGLGTNKGIYLVQIAQKAYALAVSDNSINTICQLEHSGPLQELLQKNETDLAENNSDFWQILNRTLTKLTKGGTEDG